MSNSIYTSNHDSYIFILPRFVYLESPCSSTHLNYSDGWILKYILKIAILLASIDGFNRKSKQETRDFTWSISVFPADFLLNQSIDCEFYSLNVGYISNIPVISLWSVPIVPWVPSKFTLPSSKLSVRPWQSSGLEYECETTINWWFSGSNCWFTRG